jgi:hypothetical protein
VSAGQRRNWKIFNALLDIVVERSRPINSANAGEAADGRKGGGEQLSSKFKFYLKPCAGDGAEHLYCWNSAGDPRIRSVNAHGTCVSTIRV